MNNELIKQKSWWSKNWKWFISICILLFISVFAFVSSGMGEVASDLTKAYSDNQLFEGAIKKANANPKVVEYLGKLEPLDRMAILEGQIQYQNKNQTVTSSVRIIGAKGKARMDFEAYKINTEWIYTDINVRIRKPVENKQTIEIDTQDQTY